MKIALYNWAPVHGNFDEGGGVSVYLKNIVQELALQGHDVIVLSSGYFYDLERKDVYLRKNDFLYSPPETPGLVSFVDIINSRVIAPAYLMFHNIEICLNEESTKMAVREFLSDYGPFDVFHVQNFEGIPYSALELKSEFPNTRFMLSNHNYHSVCQQVNLWYNEGAVCEDYYNGIACYSCVSFQTQFANFFASRGFITQINRKILPEDNRAIEVFLERFKSIDISWFSDFRLNDKSFERRCIDTHGVNKFQYRRERAVHLMNKHLDIISSVSDFTASVLQKSGLDMSKMHINYIGTRHYREYIPRRQQRQKDVLGLCFLGYTRRDKGFYFLMDALVHMPSDMLGKVSLTFAGKIEDPNALALMKSVEGRLSKLVIVNQYKHSDLPVILANVDIGIVPPLWYDALPQIAIEFLCNGVPILVSDLGGQQEIIGNKDFVFSAGDREDFWRKIKKVYYDQNSIEKFWKAGVRIFSNKHHVEELLKLYHSGQGSKSTN